MTTGSAKSAPRRGRLIAIEGIDGAGTTTQARLLVEWLCRHDAPAALTHEPSDGPIGLLLRRILTHQTRTVESASLALLFAADRLDHCAAEVEPLLSQGRHVVTDRYVYSSFAYQGTDLDLSWVAAINSEAPEPDLTLYLRVDPAVAARRRGARGGRAEVFETNPQQRRIASLYDSFFGEDPRSGSWVPDPVGGTWIQSNCRQTSPVLAAVGRKPAWAVVDGDEPVDRVQNAIRNLVQNICASP